MKIYLACSYECNEGIQEIYGAYPNFEMAKRKIEQEEKIQCGGRREFYGFLKWMENRASNEYRDFVIKETDLEAD